MRAVHFSPLFTNCHFAKIVKLWFFLPLLLCIFLKIMGCNGQSGKKWPCLPPINYKVGHQKWRKSLRERLTLMHMSAYFWRKFHIFEHIFGQRWDTKKEEKEGRSAKVGQFGNCAITLSEPCVNFKWYSRLQHSKTVRQ